MNDGKETNELRLAAGNKSAKLRTNPTILVTLFLVLAGLGFAKVASDYMDQTVKYFLEHQQLESAKFLAAQKETAERIKSVLENQTAKTDAVADARIERCHDISAQGSAALLELKEVIENNTRVLARTEQALERIEDHHHNSKGF